MFNLIFILTFLVSVRGVEETTTKKPDEKKTTTKKPRIVRNATVLNDDEFLDVITSEERVTIFYFAPWDPRSKQFKKEWMRLVNEWPDDPPMVFGQLDVTRNKVSTSHLTKFPQIVYYAFKQPIYYSGLVDADHMRFWLQRVAEDPPVEDEVQEPDYHPAVTIYAPEMPDWYSEWAAGKKHVAKFYWEPPTDGNTNITIKHDLEDPEVLKFEGEIAKETFINFFQLHEMPYVGYLVDNTWSEYAQTKVGIVWCLYEMGKNGIGNMVKEKKIFMMDVAKKLKGKFNVVYTETWEKKQNLEHLFDIKKFPTFIVQDHLSNHYHYLYEGPKDNPDLLVKFVNEVHDGKVQKRVRELNKKNLEIIPDVTEFTSSNIHKIFDDTKDTFLMIYADWCQLSRTYFQDLSDLGKKVKKDINDYVQIVRFDGAANDCSDKRITWEPLFPQFRFIPAKSKKIQNYNLKRDWKSMWRWIKRNSSYSTEIEERLLKKYDDRLKHDEL